METTSRIWDVHLVTEANALRAIALRFKSLLACPSYKKFLRRPTRQWILDNLTGFVESGGVLLRPDIYLNIEINKFLMCSFCRKTSPLIANVNETIFWACPRCLEIQFGKRYKPKEKSCQGEPARCSPDIANYAPFRSGADI